MGCSCCAALTVNGVRPRGALGTTPSRCPNAPLAVGVEAAALPGEATVAPRAAGLLVAVLVPSAVILVVVL